MTFPMQDQQVIVGTELKSRYVSHSEASIFLKIKWQYHKRIFVCLALFFTLGAFLLPSICTKFFVVSVVKAYLK